MKIGVLYCGYNCEEYLQKSIKPWIEASKNKLDGHEFVIVAVSLPFKNYPKFKKDSTTSQLQKFASEGLIKEVIDDSVLKRDFTEVEARGIANTSLIEDDFDLQWQVDSDEFYTLEDISNIIKYVEKDPLIAWYRLSFKNYIFDEKTYLEEPFTPPRIHRNNVGKYYLHKFTDDNDMSYYNNGKIINQKELSSQTIPTKVAWIKHLTWFSDARSKAKIEYHLKHFGQCSYKWGEGLEIDYDYYTKNGLKLPIILKEK